MSGAFLNTQAVETWDTWFRWRERGQLRDLTIESTWQRVATCLTSQTPRGGRAEYQRRLLDAFGNWQLLPDRRVIATAGTPRHAWRPDDLVAVLNAVRFVRSPGLPRATLDTDRIEDVAALAVYALDDAAALVGSDDGQAQLQVGVVGLGEALAQLGVAYDSAEGRAYARLVAKKLCSGSLAGAVARARDRGARARCDEAWRQRAIARDLPLELIDAAQRYGLRCAQLTAITSQPQLAALANDVADAIDPARDESCPSDACTRRPDRRVARAGLASRLAPDAAVPAQLQMRAAMQPWIDAPIAYPLLSAADPDGAAARVWSELARELKLAPLTWRTVLAECDARLTLPHGML